VINDNNEKYLTFDTVKIKCNYKYLINKYIKFNETYNHKTGDLTCELYNSKDDSQIPYNLFIAVSYTQKTLTLEFSSKVLLQDYPKLISKYTIRQCLENINKLRICELDIESILSTGCFTRLDVTTDKELLLTESVLDSLSTSVKNYKRFKWSHYENEGITFTKDVKSIDCKESITLYNKGKELMNKANNNQFLNLLPNRNEVCDYFRNKTRFEIKLSTQDKIKSYLSVSDTKILSVLNSKANPIQFQFKQVFGSAIKVKPEYNFSNYDDYCMSLIIESNNYDMKLVDQKVRSLFSRTGYYERKKKLDAVYERMRGSESDDTIEKILSLLSL